MYFTNIFLFGLVATATALPQKRGGRRKCSSVFPSTTGTSDHVSTTPILSSSSSIVVTPSSSDPISTPIISNPVSSSATPSTSSDVASTPISSESSATTPGTTPPASTTPESSTIASSTPGSSVESSTPIASSTDSGSIVPSSTPSSTSESSTPSSTPVESSTAPSSTPSSTSESSTPVASSTMSSSTIASTTSIASTTAASTTAASTTAASTTAASTTAASTGAARPRPTAGGDIPAGVEYYGCNVPGQVGLAFAQGPYEYTAQALDLLDASGFKATFFLNGNNWGSIYDYSAVVQRIYSSSHQIGSNTWNNADLSTLDKNGIESELYQLEDALRSIVGVYPTYLLPPNGNTNQLVRDTAKSLGYKIIKPDIITHDEQHQSDINTAINNFNAGLDAGGSIALVHDVYQATVQTMLPAMIDAINQRGLTAVTLGTCFGMPARNSYSTAP